MLHQREVEILNILFSSEVALASLDIIEAGNKLSQSTVQAVLRKLLQEGLVMVEGVTISRNVLSRTYRPTEAARELIKQQYLEGYKAIMHIVPVNEIIQELMKKGGN